ncbi:MAG: hypothetical protein M3440_08740 [Chloroflexota bacterium]|nr:hypothetical protein [Chloroflexota bacterium]
MERQFPEGRKTLQGVTDVMNRCLAASLLAAWCLVMTALPSQARVETISGAFVVPVDFIGGAGCSSAGEQVAFSGNYRLHYRFTARPGGGFHSQVHTVNQGVMGYGLTSGDRYTFVGVSSEVTNQASSMAAQEFTIVMVTRFVSAGENHAEDDAGFSYANHVTITPSGEVKAILGDTAWECR